MKVQKNESTEPIVVALHFLHLKLVRENDAVGENGDARVEEDEKTAAGPDTDQNLVQNRTQKVVVSKLESDIKVIVFFNNMMKMNIVDKLFIVLVVFATNSTGNETDTTNTTNINTTSVSEVIAESTGIFQNLAAVVITLGASISAGAVIRKWWKGKKEKETTSANYEERLKFRL